MDDISASASARQLPVKTGRSSGWKLSTLCHLLKGHTILLALAWTSPRAICWGEKQEKKDFGGMLQNGSHFMQVGN